MIDRGDQACVEDAPLHGRSSRPVQSKNTTSAKDKVPMASSRGNPRTNTRSSVVAVIADDQGPAPADRRAVPIVDGPHSRSPSTAKCSSVNSRSVERGSSRPTPDP